MVKAMKGKKVSVIIPVYNAENYLKECLNSIINQTYKNLEIILINDGSKDSSNIICNYFSNLDKRIIYINKDNSGVSDTRNKGIIISTGDYITFVDSDDYLEKEMIEELVKFYEKGALVVCNRCFFQNQEVEDKKNKIINIKKYERKSFFDLYKKRIINPPFGKLYDAKIIKSKNILFKKGLNLGEDLLFNFNYLKYIDNILFINNKLYNYRVGNSISLSKKYFSNMIEIQKTLIEKYEDFFDINRLDVLKEEENFIAIMITNELHNHNIATIKRYYNARMVMNNKYVNEKINMLREKNAITFLDYFLLKNKFVISFLLKRKIIK